MARPKKWPPTIHKHASGQAFIRVDGKNVYLGPYGSHQVQEKYRRLIITIETGRSPDAPGSTLTILELVACWDAFAREYYEPSGREYPQFKPSLQPLIDLYGSLPVDQFGPKALKLVQAEMARRWCRNVVNRRLTRVKTMWRWAESEELVPKASYHALLTVRGLPKNARNVKHTAPIAPAREVDVRAVLPHIKRPAVQAMLWLQWLTGMRSCEVRTMRTCDVDQADATCWIYWPAKDKNAWREGMPRRVIPLGPECQRVLEPWLRPADLEGYVFRALRNRGTCYTDNTYAQAVARACEKAGVKFTPYQCRHAAKLRVERLFGADAARKLLGHRSVQTTLLYGQMDLEGAAEIMRKIG